MNEYNIEKYTAYLNSDQIQLLKGTIRNREITKRAKKILLTTPLDHEAIGNLLTEHHIVLRNVLKISTLKIDRMIKSALKAGAYGAKINGSGGGGCMFAYAPGNTQKIKEAIEKEGGKAFIIHTDLGTLSSKFEIAL
ncbi:MAG TPA: hypothetical protein ENI61_02505 [Ignavibacteria bacterium]|nr:hypothetical protein [Ignavibacteria bacterium]